MYLAFCIVSTANHLVFCSKRTCYLEKPEVPTSDKVGKGESYVYFIFLATFFFLLEDSHVLFL